MKIIEKTRALNNKTKFRMLSLLAEMGAKSITEISQILNLNFSTTHKYLEQLENAGFVKSKQEKENRLKRIFYIQNFSIHITPRNISKILRNEDIKYEKEAYSSFKIITNSGKLETFNKYEFAKPYMSAGIPRNTMETVFDSIKSQVYNGITFLELKDLMNKNIKRKSETISKVLNHLKKQKEQNTFSESLERKFPTALELHKKGHIFIQNTGKPRLLNFIHNINKIGNCKNLDELLKKITIMIKKINKISNKKHGLDSFNYFITPFSKSINDAQLRDKLINFFKEINDSQIVVAIEVGVPKFYKEMIFNFKDKKEEITKEAKRVTRILKEIRTKDNISFIYKIWDKEQLPQFNPTKSIDMNLEYMGKNSSFIYNTHFGSEWGGWGCTTGVGEVQRVHINLHSLAEGKNFSEFYTKLNKILNETLKLIEVVGEKTNGFLARRNNKIQLEGNKNHNYIKISDLLYTISLYGLGEILNKYKENENKIIELINSKKTESPFRIKINITQDKIPKKRFEKVFGTKQNTNLIKNEILKRIKAAHLKLNQ